MRRLIDVGDHGFRAEDTVDAGRALRRAVNAARDAGGPVRLILPPGDYHVWPETAPRRELFVSNTVGIDPRFATKSIGLLLDDLEGVEVVADGARLVAHGRMTALAIVDGSGVTVDGLEVDWAVPTVIDVTVADAGVDGNGAWRELTVPACTRFRIDGTDVVWMSEPSPFTGELYWSGANALAYSQVSDPTTGRTRRAACPLFEGVASIERVDAATLRVTYATASPAQDRGLVYQLREIDRDHPGMLVLDCADVELRRMRIDYLHGFGLVAQNSQDLTLDGLVFRAPGGSGRVTAGFADFVQCSGMRGRVDIRDCEFDGPHDDPINVHGTYLAVTGAEPARLSLQYQHDQTAGFPAFGDGESVELVDRRTLQPVHTATVRGVTGPTGRDIASAARPITIGVADPLPPAVLAAARSGRLAAENTTRTPEVTITGCTFCRVPTRAILVTTRRPVRIEGCRFEGIAMPCIQIAADASGWWESGPVTEVAIVGNTFRDVTAGVLEVAPSVPADAAPVHGTVRFEGNDVGLAAALFAELRGLKAFTARANRVRHPAGEAAVIRADAGVHVEWDGPESPALRP
ncbi:right-handed parallel beta-helix repeat-containing protein [Microbacterium sp. NEAU-LLC]|uniref:Right-handed parallel beta-helix repeat-containing protein n=1 Tax=Microbacterium helvum TaxID=2773713 RepID=A0ABR8NLP0_9MICO|nr:right-handed parallel beta-helix repeat-containing protein [Microbacterium helvum]MBD3941357.1 right-handed parallel beta-helix repeat-containing protein [Microbacterium helvum]